MVEIPQQRRRFKVSPARFSLLLILPATGIGLLAGAREKLAERSETRPSQNSKDNGFLSVMARSPSIESPLAQSDRVPTHDHPLVGRPAPNFTLDDPTGETWDLQKLQAGSALVLIFYHGYLCPNCVRQLFDVNRDLHLLDKLGARVAAISADSPEFTRERFDQFGRFGFPILWDPGNKVRQAYQVLRRTSDGETVNLLRHGTFIIDRHGTVQWANIGDAPFRRNPALLCELAKIEGGALP
jgi:peroxiredoxin